MLESPSKNKPVTSPESPKCGGGHAASVAHNHEMKAQHAQLRRGRLTPRTITDSISVDLDFTVHSKRSAMQFQVLLSDAQGSAL